jgi:hypothetical protein
VVNTNFGKINLCVSCWFFLHFPCFASLASICYICGSTRILVFVKCRHPISLKELILKLHTKFELKPSRQTRRMTRGESLPDKPGGTGLAPVLGSVAFPLRRRVQRLRRFFQNLRTFQKPRRKVRSTRILLINFFKWWFFRTRLFTTLGDIKILSIGIRAWCSDSSLTAWSLRMSNIVWTSSVWWLKLLFLAAHVLHVVNTWAPLFERVVVARILPNDFVSEDTSNLSKDEKGCLLHNSSVWWFKCDVFNLNIRMLHLNESYGKDVGCD